MAWLAEHPGQLRPDPPRLSEWGPVPERLDHLIDLIGAFAAGLGGGKAPPSRPRPVTAIDRARRRQQLARHTKRVALVLGDHPT